MEQLKKESGIVGTGYYPVIAALISYKLFGY
jgi:hypothetical protein